LITERESTPIEGSEAPSAAPVPDRELAVALTDIGVRFRLPDVRISSFKEYVLQRLTRRVRHQDLWALRSLSLTVHAGETLGLIGRNGAGKSTLLKVVSRVLRPTEGRVVVVGTVAPLLELGAGFHPDLTGRENVFLNSALLGHPRREIAPRFDEIVRFAELQDFIDVPVRSYSSGMGARLGFSVATLFRPDILILDEVLSVGDAGFQEKCLARLEAFRQQGTTTLLVSHSPETLARHCNRVAWIEKGQLVALGEPDEVLAHYESSLQTPLSE